MVIRSRARRRAVTLARAPAAAYVTGAPSGTRRVARSSQPIFNLPPVIALLSAAFVLIHGVRALIDADADLQVLMWFAFVPARYDASLPLGPLLPGGSAAAAWSFVSYAFLHGDVVHLIVNLVWFLAFGSAVAWRFGALRFLAFFAVTAAAGALTHLATHYGEFSPLVGASAAISGAMAAAVRFAFESGGPLGFLRGRGEGAFRVPAAPLGQALRNPQVIVFLGVWFVLNLMFASSTLSAAVTEGTIAWEAHIGGFLAGLLLFPLFDPVGTAGD